MLRLAKQLGFAIVNLEEMAPHGWMHYVPTDSHWSNGFMFPRIYNQAECVVSTCCLKTHQYRWPFHSFSEAGRRSRTEDRPAAVHERDARLTLSAADDRRDQHCLLLQA